VPRSAHRSSPRSRPHRSRPHRSSPRCRSLTAAATFVALAALTAACGSGGSDGARAGGDATTATTQPAATTTTGKAKVNTIPGMPPVVDPTNLYSQAGPNMLSDAVKGDLPRVYVPNLQSNSVSVIDPSTMKVVDTIPVGINPQHVVPSWDMRTLWVTNNAEGRTDGTLTPIDAKTGTAGQPIEVDDPYNMYFTPDGKSAIVVAEARKRLDFRDPHTMALQQSLDVPECDGINHAEFSIDGSFAIFTCEFTGRLAKIDTVNKKVLGYLDLSQGGMPQDIRTAGNGSTFYVAEMMRGGLYTIDPNAFKETGFIPTGPGTHGIYPSRDGTRLYVSNRGQNHVGNNTAKGPGSVSVVDISNNTVQVTWPVPGGGSPDMGNVSADGSLLWLSGRYDDVVYVIDTKTGNQIQIPVGNEPHGLTVWPQPGRYSLGHTGNMR
jgi:YVTN family beta-propeller protein